MQSIVIGLGNSHGKEIDIINNIIDKGYGKHKKDDIPLIITLGDDETPLPSRMTNIEPTEDSNIESSEDEAEQELLRISKRFGELNTNEKLGSNQFTVSDTFLYLKEVENLIEVLDLDEKNIDLFMEKYCGVPNISAYGHKSIKLYKSVLINYSDKNKKLLATILCRALGYVIAKDLTLGAYAIGEDDNITDIDAAVCRIAIMIIAAYYSWQIMEDSGLEYKLRHNPDLERSAKIAMQAYVFGGIEFSDPESEEKSLIRHLYVLSNYITLHYVINGTKLDIRDLLAKGSADYEKAIGAMVASEFGCGRDILEIIYDKKLEKALPAFEYFIDYCIELVEKCKVSTALTNEDVKPLERIVAEARDQLTKEFDEKEITSLQKQYREKRLNNSLDTIIKMSKEDDLKKIIKFIDSTLK